MPNENFLMCVEILHVMEHSVWTVGLPTMLHENLLLKILCVLIGTQCLNCWSSVNVQWNFAFWNLACNGIVANLLKLKWNILLQKLY